MAVRRKRKGDDKRGEKGNVSFCKGSKTLIEGSILLHHWHFEGLICESACGPEQRNYLVRKPRALDLWEADVR